MMLDAHKRFVEQGVNNKKTMLINMGQGAESHTPPPEEVFGGIVWAKKIDFQIFGLANLNGLVMRTAPNCCPESRNFRCGPGWRRGL